MADAPVDEDLARLPVAERLSHKAWKARLSAYEELAQVRRRDTSTVR